MSPLACPLARPLVALLPGEAPIVLAGDDTVVAHPGPTSTARRGIVIPCASRAYTAWRYGHKWVVLAVLVRLPFANRPWALPVLVALYQSEEADRDQRRRHRTPAQHMIRLLAVMLRWFPGRRFVFVGDWAYERLTLPLLEALKHRLLCRRPRGFRPSDLEDKAIETVPRFALVQDY